MIINNFLKQKANIGLVSVMTVLAAADVSAEVIVFDDLTLSPEQVMPMGGNGLMAFQSDGVVFNYYRRQLSRNMNGEFEGAAYSNQTSYAGSVAVYSELASAAGGGMNADGSLNPGGTYITVSVPLFPGLTSMPNIPKVDLRGKGSDITGIYVSNTSATVEIMQSSFVQGDSLKLIVKAYDSAGTELTDESSRVEFLLADYSGDSLEIVTDWERVDLNIFQVNYGDTVAFLDFEMTGRASIGFNFFFSIGGLEFGSIPEPSEYAGFAGAVFLIFAFAKRRRKVC